MTKLNHQNAKTQPLPAPRSLLVILSFGCEESCRLEG